MKKWLYILTGMLLLAGCARQNRAWTVQIANPMAQERTDEGIVLSREQLDPIDDRFLPALRDTAGRYAPSQLDDLDGDGYWDELAFTVDLLANATTSLTVVWVDPADYPQFPVRTNIRYGKMTSPGVIEEFSSDLHTSADVAEKGAPGYPYQLEGVVWENDKGAFRHYYDGRNNRDYFGKRVPQMVMDTVGIDESGAPADTYHVLREWGRDVLSVGNSFGIGGLAAWVDDSLFVRLGRLAGETADVVDSTRYTLVFEGPVRSRIAFDFYGWQVEGHRLDLRQEITLWAGKHHYDNRVIAGQLPENVKLVAGFTYNLNDFPPVPFEFSGSVGAAAHDRQSYNKEYILGLGVLLPKAGVGETFLSFDRLPESELIRTWLAQLNPDSQGVADYKAYAVWELQDTLFRSRDYFLEWMQAEGDRLDHPVQVTLR